MGSPTADHSYMVPVLVKQVAIILIDFLSTKAFGQVFAVPSRAMANKADNWLDWQACFLQDLP